MNTVIRLLCKLPESY